MNIDWAALGEVFGVSLLVTVGIVGLFTLGVVGTSRKAEAQSDGTVAATGAPTLLARSGAYACFALCAVAVAYGIHLIVSG
ncbi:hypothetical protein AB0C51_24430 [Streptomyces pathocidini]|uniref:Secreted protein n=1 Tax=Streptomyces pathocidini TaxID=1650571 RepID=A0ABW7UZ47_9ACTN|nr:hypothetical protein [Streptomyces pathocidini]